MNALAPDPSRVAKHVSVSPATDKMAMCPVIVALVLLPGFDLLSLIAACEPFRLANRHAGEERFRLWHLSADGGPVMSCQAMSTQVDAAISTALDADLTLVFGASEPCEPVPSVIPAQLRRLWRTGRSVGAVQSGIFALAQAGVLSGNRFAAQQDQLALLRVHWPQLSHVDQLFCIHNRILTCVGGFAAADLSLRIIQDHVGATAAQSVMLACHMATMRDEATPQYSLQTTTRNLHLRRALRWIDRNFAREDCLSSLPEAAGTSSRHLQRLFRAHLGLRPFQYLLDLRLDRARLMLSETELRVTDVAEACGFGTTGTFSKYFRQRFGVTPSRYSPVGVKHGRCAGPAVP